MHIEIDESKKETLGPYGLKESMQVLENTAVLIPYLLMD